MTMCKASKKAMEKIMNGEVKKKSRWCFVVKNVIFWFLGFVSVLAGAVVVSLILFTVANNDGDLYQEVYGRTVSHATYFWVTLWVLVTGVFIFLCDLSVRNTKRGYTYPLWIVLVVDVILSIIFGAIFYFVGIGFYADHILGAHIDHYHNIEKRREAFFHKPEKGILLGRIVHVEGDYAEVVTMNGDAWMVFVDEMSPQKTEKLTMGSQVAFAGRTNGDGSFVACDVKVRKLYGAHRAMQKKRLEMMIEAHREQHNTLIQRMKHVVPKNLCNGEIRWRVQMER